MTSPIKNVLFVGFGAIGSIYSMVVQRSGLASVTVVARSNYNEVNRHGMHIKSGKYGHIPGWRPDRLCRSVAEAADRPYSHVVVTTKAIPDLYRTPQILAPLLAPGYSGKYPQPTYVLFQNGLNVEVDLFNAIKALGKGDPKIIGMAVYIATNLLDDNVVEHSHYDHVAMGLYRADRTITTNTPSEQNLLTEFLEMLTKGGSTAKIVPEIQRVKFSKNFWNVAWSSLATLTGYPLPSLWRVSPKDGEEYEVYASETTRKYIEQYTIPNVRAVLEEALAVARAMGIPDSAEPVGIPSSFVESTINDTAALYAMPSNSHRPSMLLDSMKGRPMEVESILGEVVRTARELAVPVPRIEMMYALLVVVQNQIIRKLQTEKREI